MSKVLNKSRASILEDLVFILYLLPIIIPIVYSLLLWPNMGQETYLKVTREPIVFIIGIISICIAMIIDIKESETNDKLKLLRVNRERIIKFLSDIVFINRVIETRPSATGIVFCIRYEKLIFTSSAHK